MFERWFCLAISKICLQIFFFKYLFGFYCFITFIHIYTSIHSTFAEVPSPFFVIACQLSSWNLPWGTKSGFELGPALQQADALPIEPRRTLIEPRRTLIEPPIYTQYSSEDFSAYSQYEKDNFLCILSMKMEVYSV